MDDDDVDPARPREWDAGSYHAVATPHQGWGAEILDRLTLRGDETVLDLGCGTGRVSAQLLERLGPEGRVLGVDGSAAMVAEATRQLGGERAHFVQQDLLELTVAQPADAGGLQRRPSTGSPTMTGSSRASARR